MTWRHIWLTALVLLFVQGGVRAGPFEMRAGEQRVVYKKQGTALRAQPSAMGATSCTLPKGAYVQVLEVKQPWANVRAVRGGQTGWLRTAEAVKPAELNPNPRPTVAPTGAQQVSQRDVTAAGRQLTGAHESGYRRKRRDLDSAYKLVDAMERATHAMDSSDSIGFIVGGALGRRGQDYVRPGLLAPTPMTSRPAQPGQQPTRQPARRPQGGGLGGALRGLGGSRGLGGALRGLGAGGIGDAVDKAGRVLDSDVVQAGAKSLQEVHRLRNERFTPENEYYMGRAVAAEALAKYGVDPDPRRRAYVRQVGDAVVRLTQRVRPNFGGYHFEVLNSDEINGVSGPGGFVLLTRGAVEACRTEAELAAILAHELGHISMRHGETTLRQGKTWQAGIQGAVRTLGAGTGLDDNALFNQGVDFFANIAGEMARNSMEHGYGGEAEYQADLEASYLLMDVNYDYLSMRSFLNTLASQSRGAYGRAATLAPPPTRMSRLDQQLGRYGAWKGSERVKEARLARFNGVMGR